MMPFAPVRLAVALLTLAGAASAADAPIAPGRVGGPFPDAIPAERLTARWWIERCPGAETILLDPDAAAAQNARVVAAGNGLHDLARLPERIPRKTVADLVTGLAAGNGAVPRPLDDRAASPDPRSLTALEAIPAEVVPRFALAVRRADLRTYPSDVPGRAKPTDTDIDRFQESALFPATPVAILHTSADDRYAFVLAPHYAAWVAADALATADRDTVLGYVAAARRVITAPTLRVAPETAPGSTAEVVLDMGVRVLEAPDWALDAPIGGQGILGGLAVRLPSRGADGGLVLAPALLPRSADTHPGPLPVSRANLLRQAFKCLGERYCWGHGGPGRDCSGFVGESHRSLGLVLPRNSRDQAACTASFLRTEIPAGADRAARMAALATALPGDLVHVPGHVMMVVGHDETGPWIIHDSHAATVRGPDGRPRRLPTNSVVVCPLEPLLREDGRSIVDVVTVLQRYLPSDPLPATAQP